MTAQACDIHWGYSKGVPANPPPPEERNCIGRPRQVRLIPYGAAKIHIAEFPTVDLSHGLGRQPADQQPLGMPRSDL
jgi:hypothetical protein